MGLVFKTNETPFTLGVEAELQLLDASTFELTPRASELLAATEHPQIIKEMFSSTVELVTGICEDAHQACAEIDFLKKKVVEWGDRNNVVFASTGTHPTGDFNERIVMPSERYVELLDRNQWLIRRMAVYGLHVHIGMRNGDECIQFANYFLKQLPYFLALSASSPFWNKSDTGLDCVRPTMYESHPTSGMPYLASDWRDLESLYDDLISTGSIQSMKDIWWDLRPSPNYGTLELRMCDMPATHDELSAIVALAHLMALDFDRKKSKEISVPKRWLLRENKWRAIRYSIDAELISHDNLSVFKLRDGLVDFLDNAGDLIDQYNYHKEVKVLKEILDNGNSAKRQRKIFEEKGELLSVARFND